MHQFLPFIVIGLATGAVYGLAGMGVVLTFKTSGILNLGYGSIAALDAFLFYILYVEHQWPWPLAVAVCLLVFAPLLGLLMELLARSLTDASETIKVVATVGIILIVEAIGLLWHETNPPTFPHFLSQSTVSILGVNVTWEQIILFGFSLVAGTALYLFFRFVRLGVVMRGVVDNHELVAMSGDNPVRVRRWAWIVGTVFAAAAGLLLSPTFPVDGVTLPTAVFSAFGAAAIGYFSSLPLTFGGGLVIGIAGALLDKYAATIPGLSGLPVGLPVIVLVLVLILIPRRRLVQRRLVAVAPTRRSYYAPTRVRLAAGVAVLALLALIPAFQQSQVALWSAALIDVILFLSLGLLVRKSGQISLCQLAFAAVGAAAFGHFAADHMPWLLALVLATLVAAPVGALIAIPAVRVSGVFLALATLGFGILMEQVFYPRGILFGDNPLGLTDPRPNFSIGGWNLSSDTGFYYVILIVTVLVVLFVISISTGRLGRLLEALSDSPVALETGGMNSSGLKVIVFCIAAAIASLSGALTGMLYTFASGSYFPSFTSLEVVAVVVIVTVGDPWFALLAAVGYAVIPGYITGSTSTWLTLLFGVFAVTAAYSTRSPTVPVAVRQVLDRLGGRRPAAATPSAAVEGGPAAEHEPPSLTLVPPPRESRREGLVLKDISVNYGGVKAVDKVSLRAPMGEITGLVGPNGAGKTSLFNASSGLIRIGGGSVFLRGAEVTGASTSARARRGMGRTFQRTQLFDSLTVRQNVAMGREAPLAGANPLSQVLGSRRANRAVAAATEESLALTGTTRLADEQAGLLPVGQRRLVELARALAGDFDLLLLDEPSSGLDAHETEEFGRVLRRVVAERGCGILLVEHDMALVREVCDSVYVLDFGMLIFEGDPQEMLASAQVRAAYLGDAAVTAGSPADPPAASGERQAVGGGE
jgi:ABC-type branched-subunit amino acid transport system ATPase component/branched-subunit amino acid ABC-type transport system permease component